VHADGTRAVEEIVALSPTACAFSRVSFHSEA
jgi:hypothetical protein